MDRRTFLKASAGAAAAVGGGYSALAQTVPQSRRISIAIHPEQALGEIPADFLGLGYEISSVARPGLLSARSTAYVQFVRNLGRRGVIRIGGNTSDFSSYAKDGPA